VGCILVKEVISQNDSPQTSCGRLPWGEEDKFALRRHHCLVIVAVWRTLLRTRGGRLAKKLPAELGLPGVRRIKMIRLATEGE